MMRRLLSPAKLKGSPDVLRVLARGNEFRAWVKVSVPGYVPAGLVAGYNSSPTHFSALVQASVLAQILSDPQVITIEALPPS
jgi:hypothetical protein